MRTPLSGRLGRRATIAAVALVAGICAPPASASHPVYSGTGAHRHVRVRLDYLSGNTRATIRLSWTLAARVAERSVRLSCGLGNYGGDEPLVTMRWPRGKRVMEVGSGRALGGIDRCRVSSRHRLSVPLRMHRRA